MTADATAPLHAGRVRPFWLRPAALLAAAGVHVYVVLFLTIPRPVLPSPVDTIEITIAPQMGSAGPEDPTEVSPDSIAQPETPPDPTAEPDPDAQPQPVVPPDPEPVTPPDPPPDPPVEVAETLPPDPVPVADPPPDPPLDAPVEAVETPPEAAPVAAEPPVREAPDAPVIARQIEPQRAPPIDREKLLEPQRRLRRRREAARRAAAQSAATSRAGVADGMQQSAMSRATFAAKVLAEIRSHRISAPGEGSVGIDFVVDAAGVMTSVSVIRSSGDEALDSAASRMVRAARPGPPPGGFFAGSTTINFVAR